MPNNKIIWKKQGVVIPNNKEGKFDSVHTYGPCVIKDGPKYKMWYSGHDGTTERILYSESAEGVEWKKPKLVLDVSNYMSEYIEGGNKVKSAPYHQRTQDNLHAYAPFVLKERNHYKMWYLGKYDEHIYKLFYAVSKDGLEWTKLGLSLDLNPNAVNANNYDGRFDTHHVSYPFVLRDKNGLYQMWYTGKDHTHMRILHAYSFEGFHWFRTGIVLNIDKNGSGSLDTCYPHLTFNDDLNRWEMFYTGFDTKHKRTLLALSTDRKDWVKCGVTLNVSKTGPDSVHAYTPTVIYDQGLYRMWYSGFDGKTYQICYAEGRIAND